MDTRKVFSWRKTSTSVCRKLNTKQFCFFCLKAAEIVENVTFEDTGGDKCFGGGQNKSISLASIRRHLKINLNKQTSSSVPFLKTDEVEVSVCQVQLFSEVERVQMEMGYYLGIIQDRIGEATRTPEVVQNYSKEMTGDMDALSQLAFVDKLRKEIFTKCSNNRFRCSHQTVEMTKVEVDDRPIPILIKVELPQEVNTDANETEFSPEGKKPAISNRTNRPVLFLHCSKNIFKRNPTTLKYSCPACHKNIGKIRDARIHYDSVHLKRKLKCEICKETFSSGSLYNHTRICQNKSLPKFACSICKESFSGLHQLIKHKRLHRTGKRYPCGYCDKNFFTRSGREDHVNSIHLKKKTYCKYCKKEYLNRHSRLFHEKNCSRKVEGSLLEATISQSGTTPPHSNTPEKVKKFQFRNTDGAKKQVQARKKRNFNGPDGSEAKSPCSISMNQEFSLLETVTNFNKSISRPFKDTKRNPHASHPERLQKEYKHSCSSCGKKFRNSHHVIRHQQTVHLNVRMFACALCGKSYKQKEHLKRHKISAHFK